MLRYAFAVGLFLTDNPRHLILDLDELCRQAPPTVDAGTPMPDAGTPDAGVPVGRVINVESIAKLQEAINVSRPGDELVLKDGTYSTTGPITVADKTAVTIRAQTVGGAKIQGKAGFMVKRSSYITVSGFVLTHDVYSGNGLLVWDSNNIRISRNEFALTETTARNIWLLIDGQGSHHNVVERNLFRDKKSTNDFVVIYGDDDVGGPAVSRHDRIERNHFLRQASGEEDGECLRIGDSERGPQSAWTVVEANLFEQCNSDDESISVKASDVTLAGNTLRGNQGSLTLRHGNRNRVVENNFLASNGGLRLYGHDHLVEGNYFANNTGESARSTLIIMSGCNEADTGEGTDCARVRNCTVRGNALVGNTRTHLVVGHTDSRRPLVPVGCTIEGNYLEGATGKLVENQRVPEGFTWTSNVYWGAASDGDAPAGSFTRAQMTPKPKRAPLTPSDVGPGSAPGLSPSVRQPSASGPRGGAPANRRATSKAHSQTDNASFRPTRTGDK
jgi:poly(beta-D-mannuronate) lyase